MKRIAFPLVSALALFTLLAVQNALLLTTASLRMLADRRALHIPHLFALVFLPALMYAAAVLFDLDFNAVSIATGGFCTAVFFASTFCLAAAFLPRSAATSPAVCTAPSPFSGREQEVVALVVQGKTTQETADELCISVSTVKTHLQHIYEKAGVRNRTELAQFVQNHSIDG